MKYRCACVCVFSHSGVFLCVFGVEDDAGVFGKTS